MFNINSFIGGLFHQIPSTTVTAFQVFMDLFSERGKNKASKNETQEKFSKSSKDYKK